MNLALTLSALAELLEAVAYIGQHDATAAERFKERVNRALERVTAFPSAGGRLPERPNQRYREVIASPYRIIYRIVNEEVIIVSFWHQSRAAWTGDEDAD